VLVAPNWATRISWEARKIFVNISREAIENSPPWDGSPVRREYEVRMHDYHRRAGYWTDEPEVRQEEPLRRRASTSIVSKL
jgi:hypothetical protein